MKIKEKVLKEIERIEGDGISDFETVQDSETIDLTLVEVGKVIEEWMKDFEWDESDEDYLTTPLHKVDFKKLKQKLGIK